MDLSVGLVISEQSDKICHKDRANNPEILSVHMYIVSTAVASIKLFSGSVS